MFTAQKMKFFIKDFFSKCDPSFVQWLIPLGIAQQFVTFISDFSLSRMNTDQSKIVIWLKVFFNSNRDYCSLLFIGKRVKSLVFKNGCSSSRNVTEELHIFFILGIKVSVFSDLQNKFIISD